MGNTKPGKSASERYAEYREKLQQMRLMDDTFMTAVFEDKECAEILIRIILERDDIFVKEITTQKTIPNFIGHSVRLDMKIEDSDHVLYDVEIQRSKEGADPKRARHNSGALDANSLPAGKDYSEMPDTYVIFITESDIFEAGLPLYHIERMILELGKSFNDGEHIIYVNSTIQDDTQLGRLMHDFYCVNSEDILNETLRKRVQYFKSDQKGVDHMCEIMEQIADENREIGRAEGRVEGRAEGEAKALMALVRDGILTKENAAKRFGGTYEELERAASYVTEN